MLKLVISATLVTSPFLQCFEQFGWHTMDGHVQITWDNNEDTMEETESSSEEESDGEDKSEGEGSVSERSEIPIAYETDSAGEDDGDGAL